MKIFRLFNEPWTVQDCKDDKYALIYASLFSGLKSDTTVRKDTLSLGDEQRVKLHYLYSNFPPWGNETGILHQIGRVWLKGVRKWPTGNLKCLSRTTKAKKSKKLVRTETDGYTARRVKFQHVPSSRLQMNSQIHNHTAFPETVFLLAFLCQIKYRWWHYKKIQNFTSPWRWM